MDSKSLNNKVKRKRSPSPIEKKNSRKRSPSPTDKKRRGNRVRSNLNTPNATTPNNKKKSFKTIDEDSQDAVKDNDVDSPESTHESTQNRKTQNSNNKEVNFNNNEHNKDSNGDTNEEEKNNIDKVNSPNSLDSNVASPVGKTNDKSRDNYQDDNVTEQANHIIIPSYSAWFDYNAIHTVERRALPEFFNNENKSKTAEVYLAYRNFMIDTYRLNPTEYLTVTACRRNLAGDVCTIMRVHAFLEQWGLINYQVESDARPTPMGPPSTSHFHVLIDTPSGLQTSNSLRPTTQTNGVSLNANYSNINKENEIKEIKQMNLTNGSLNKENFGLKTDQYSKKDEYYKNQAVSKLSREWTDQEILLLLEGIDKYKDDWNKVCEHVGSRTQDECILQFLRLPIEDPYLEEGDSNVLGPLAYQPIPFSKIGNPIMSTVAFLASVVDPRIASAATKTAMEEFAKIKDEVPSSLLNAHLKHVELSAAEGKLDLKASLSLTSIAGTDEKESEEKDSKTDDTKSSVDSLKKEDSKSTQPENGDKNDIKNADKDEKMEVEKEKTSSDKNKENSTVSEKNSKEEKEDFNKKGVVSKLDPETEKLIKDGQLTAAASAALASAAVKAKHLAAIEERKIKSLVALLVETQMKKLEIKLRHFEELEAMMDKERETLEYQRQQLIQERQQFHMEQLRAAEFRAKQQAHVQFYQNNNVPPPPNSIANQNGPLEEALQNCVQRPQYVPMMNNTAINSPRPSGMPAFNWTGQRQPIPNQINAPINNHPQILNQQMQIPNNNVAAPNNLKQPPVGQQPFNQGPVNQPNLNTVSSQSPSSSPFSVVSSQQQMQSQQTAQMSQVPGLEPSNMPHNVAATPPVHSHMGPPNQMLPPQAPLQKLIHTSQSITPVHQQQQHLPLPSQPQSHYPHPSQSLHHSHIPVHLQQQVQPPHLQPPPPHHVQHQMPQMQQPAPGQYMPTSLPQTPMVASAPSTQTIPHMIQPINQVPVAQHQMPAPIQAIEQMTQMQNPVVKPPQQDQNLNPSTPTNQNTLNSSTPNSNSQAQPANPAPSPVNSQVSQASVGSSESLAPSSNNNSQNSLPVSSNVQNNSSSQSTSNTVPAQQSSQSPQPIAQPTTQSPQPQVSNNNNSLPVHQPPPSSVPKSPQQSVDSPQVPATNVKQSTPNQSEQTQNNSQTSAPEKS
ncbi:hypothetical protein RND71_044016 [Anisodus tanguticus]|uniref:SWI/SNF complex subunit SMARCC2 n=1 Tax=Anisodus tanguticus TaxID=243964 RepID=A0AAE1QNJ4_9SOLA|nr:hypothetical protein RND71_044016 [Anisodus tanguticus]